MISKIICTTLLHLLILLISLNSFSQDFSYFDFEKTFDWSPYEHVSTDILKSNFKVLKEKPHSELIDLLEKKDKFHFIDIDNDQVNEIVYNGWNGGEGEMVVVYKLIKNQLVEVQKFYGRILSIRINEMNQTRFIVYDYSCCAGYVDHLQTFDFNSKTKLFEIKSAIAKINQTDIPDTWLEPFRFEIQKTPYNLRYSPEILKVQIRDSPFSDPIKGENIAAIYQAGDKGTVYAESTDSSGRVWWFVVMDAMPKSGEVVYYDGNNEFKNYQPVGWISSKYVERIIPK